VESNAIQLRRSSSLLVQDLEEEIHPVGICKGTMTDLVDAKERDVRRILRRGRGTLQRMVTEDMRVDQLGDELVRGGEGGFGKRRS
jgi:hypothetical protein